MELPAGDLKAHPGFPWHGATVQMKRPSARTHEHGLPMVVAELVAEQVSEIRYYAGVAD